jgi:hypothetical protein
MLQTVARVRYHRNERIWTASGTVARQRRSVRRVRGSERDVLGQARIKSRPREVSRSLQRLRAWTRLRVPYRLRRRTERLRRRTGADAMTVEVERSRRGSGRGRSSSALWHGGTHCLDSSCPGRPIVLWTGAHDRIGVGAGDQLHEEGAPVTELARGPARTFMLCVEPNSGQAASGEGSPRTPVLPGSALADS